jgi:hypothetical protein
MLCTVAISVGPRAVSELTCLRCQMCEFVARVRIIHPHRKHVHIVERHVGEVVALGCEEPLNHVNMKTPTEMEYVVR